MSGCHTKGPWVATPSSATIRARRTVQGAFKDYRIDNSVIANLPTSSDRYANACLIAAAPCMLEALESVLDEYELRMDGPVIHSIDKVRATIAKARGDKS